MPHMSILSSFNFDNDGIDSNNEGKGYSKEYQSLQFLVVFLVVLFGPKHNLSLNSKSNFVSILRNLVPNFIIVVN